MAPELLHPSRQSDECPEFSASPPARKEEIDGRSWIQIAAGPLLVLLVIEGSAVAVHTFTDLWRLVEHEAIVARHPVAWRDDATKLLDWVRPRSTP
ncbi:MAG: hypothetical protein Q9188_004853 [Gyalolechia gomerana]